MKGGWVFSWGVSCIGLYRNRNEEDGNEKVDERQ